MPYVYDLKNPKLKSLYEAYLKKWVDSTRGLDNVIFEIENEGYSGYEFNNWVATVPQKRTEVQLPYRGEHVRGCGRVPCHSRVDIICDHGEKSPREVGDLQAELSRFGKVVIVDTDGWRTSEQSYEKSLQVAQRALDLDMHFNHKARTNKPCGDTGKPFVELMAGIVKDPSKPSAYRLSEVDLKQKVLHIILDEKNVENGIRLDLPWDGSADGWTEVVQREGKQGRANAAGPEARKGGPSSLM